MHQQSVRTYAIIRIDEWVRSSRNANLVCISKIKSSEEGGELMLGRKRKERVRSIGNHLCLLKKENINVLALMARQDFSLIYDNVFRCSEHHLCAAFFEFLTDDLYLYLTGI